MPFPQTLGPLGVTPLPLDCLPVVQRGEKDCDVDSGIAEPSGTLANARHGYYLLDLRQGSDRVLVTVSAKNCPLAFDGVIVAKVQEEGHVEMMTMLQSDVTPFNDGLSAGRAASPGQLSLDNSRRPGLLSPAGPGQASPPKPGLSPAVRGLSPPNGRPLRPPTGRRLSGVQMPGNPLQRQRSPSQTSDGGGALGILSPRGARRASGSGRFRLAGLKAAPQQRAVCQQFLPGMRVVEAGAKRITSAKDLHEALQACQEPQIVLLMQDDESAALLPLLGLPGVTGCGALSPASPVVFAAEERRAANIPAAAETFAMGYPLEGLHGVPEDVLKDLDWGDPLVQFALLGGFIYLDADGGVCGANAITSGEQIHFDGPFPWRQEYTEQLRADGRIVPITLKAFREAGAQFFAYLTPGETLGGFNGLPAWRISRNGGFVYLMGDPQTVTVGSPVGPSATPAGHRSSTVRRSSGGIGGEEPMRDIFFVMLGRVAAEVQGDSWEQVRICPHCHGQQREDLSMQEVPGMLRCDNCGQLSPLFEREDDSDRQNLIRGLAQLTSYILLLAIYVCIGAAVMQAVELPAEEDALRDWHRRFNNTLSKAAQRIAALANRSGGAGVPPDLVLEHLRNFTKELHAGQPGVTEIPCEPQTELKWENFSDAMFWVFAMVITIPVYYPVTTAGRVVFVFYVAGGLMCVLKVIFDLAHVIPSVCRAVIRLFQAKRKALSATEKEEIQKRSEDLFAIVDYDGSGTLTLAEFREFLEQYEEGKPIDEDIVQELMLRVDDGSGQLSRDDVRKATVLWERMKEDAAQIPGSLMVVLSVFGNLSWVFVCAFIYTRTDGMDYREALWLCFLTLTNMGFGVFWPKSFNGKMVTYFYFLIGLGSLAWLFAAIGSKGKQRLLSVARDILGSMRGHFPCLTPPDNRIWQRLLPPVSFYSPSDTFGELSPEFPASLEIDGKAFPSILHYIVYERFRGTRHERKTRLAENIQTLHHIVQQLVNVPPRPTWDSERDDVMLRGLCCREQQDRRLRDTLQSTGDRQLVYDVSDAPPEYSQVFDFEYWGANGETGNNRLGELLMMMRSDMRKGIKTEMRPGVGSQQPLKFFGYLNAQYAVLTPSFPSPFVDTQGLQWRTVDHFYQASKFASAEYRECIRVSRTPFEALELGRARDVPGGLIPDWDTERIRKMNEGLIHKFAQNPRARERLLQTNNRTLIFADSSDPFWGDKQEDGEDGLNVMGQLLMKLREKLRAGVTPKQLLNENDAEPIPDGIIITRSAAPLALGSGTRRTRKFDLLRTVTAGLPFVLRPGTAASQGAVVDPAALPAQPPPADHRPAPLLTFGSPTADGHPGLVSPKSPAADGSSIPFALPSTVGNAAATQASGTTSTPDSGAAEQDRDAPPRHPG
eukprot:TRINITY_DN70346_c0_g1_i1.p1 TRINITY_DN70346_c0_g1~~TRINITY_DN70346_c0_g1_i1.p1  ORF type:complete len:1429 (+),score=244.84 TRINITY_DN70346_c0_g1_i1:113-4288(+)